MNENNNGNRTFDGYTYRAVKKNKTDIVFSITSYISAAVLYFPSVYVDGIKYASVLQLCALAALVSGIYINQRYTWVSYIYSVSPREDPVTEEITSFYFCVCRIYGKRRNYLAKIDMADCIAVLDCTHKDKRKADIAKYGVTARYDFRATMAPASYCRAIFKTDGEVVAISFEPDETLRAILMQNSGRVNKEEDT